MTATRSDGDVRQLVLRPREVTGDSGTDIFTSFSTEPSVSVPGIIWYDIRDRVWRGVVPGLSLFADSTEANEVRQLLVEKVSTYIEDAQEQELERELVPRPLPDAEWRKLRFYLWVLGLRARFANALFPALAVPMPVVQRVAISWHR